MADPLVSVAMVTYNHAPFIAQAIEGVLHQKTKFPFELVIGEDCSTDDTQAIVLDYGRRYPDIIHVITSERNVGAKKNNQRTMQACRGKYCAFCEGDDYWHSAEKMQIQAGYLENHSECGLVYSNYDVYHVESKKLIKNFIEFKKKEIPENPSMSDIISGRAEILTCTVMLRRSLMEPIIEADPYIHESDKFLMGDTQLWAEMATVANLKYLPDSLATHCITNESATRSKKDINKELRFEISNAELLLYLCEKHGLASSIREKCEEYWCQNSLWLAYNLRNVELAEEVRRKSQRFTWKQWMLYGGTKNMAVHSLCRAAIFSRNMFIKKHDPWM